MNSCLVFVRWLFRTGSIPQEVTWPKGCVVIRDESASRLKIYLFRVVYNHRVRQTILTVILLLAHSMKHSHREIDSYAVAIVGDFNFDWSEAE